MTDKMTYANSADPDQTAPEEQSDQGLHCLPFHYFRKHMHNERNLAQNTMEWSVRNIRTFTLSQ